MKTISVNGKEVLMCELRSELPLDSAEIDKETEALITYHKGGWYDDYCLPLGDWHLLGLASEISESTAQTIMPMQEYTYQSYTKTGSVYFSAKPSLLSLLKAHGYKEGNCLLLIKK